MRFSSFILMLIVFAGSSNAFSQNVQGTEALNPQDRQKILRALVLTEQIIRIQESSWRRDHSSLATFSEFPGPLSPQESCFTCTDAAYLFSHLVALQGVEQKYLRLYETSQAGGHSFVVFEARLKGSEQRAAVFLDPTWVQFERFGYSSVGIGLEKNADNPASLLMKSEHGREILAQIRREGVWIPNEESFVLWRKAMSLDSKTGDSITYQKQSLKDFLALEESNRIRFHEKMKQRAEGYANTTSRQLINSVDRINNFIIESRVKTGKHFSPEKFACGNMFLQTVLRD